MAYFPSNHFLTGDRVTVAAHCLNANIGETGTVTAKADVHGDVRVRFDGNDHAVYVEKVALVAAVPVEVRDQPAILLRVFLRGADITNLVTVSFEEES